MVLRRRATKWAEERRASSPHPFNNLPPILHLFIWVMQRRLLGLLGPHLAVLEAELSHRQACCLVSVLGR